MIVREVFIKIELITYEVRAHQEGTYTSCCLFFLFLVGTSSCKKGDDPKPEYIEIIVDGEKTYYETKDISTSDSFVHFTVTVMYPSSDIYLHIDGFKNDLLKTVPYGSKGMNLFGGKTKIDYKAKHNLSFTLLNYGSVGEFIDIKFN